MHFGGCQTQDNSGQSSPQTRFLKNKIIFCKKYPLSSMYNDIFILLNNCIRTSVTSYLLSLYIVIGLIESNHCYSRAPKTKTSTRFSSVVFKFSTFCVIHSSIRIYPVMLIILFYYNFVRVFAYIV